MSHEHLRATAIVLILCCAAVLAGCPVDVNTEQPNGEDSDATGRVRIILLHHSTGECIWNGGVEAWFAAYNQAHGTDYRITEQAFPKSEPYGWNNYPYDYWNIWVRHAGATAYMTEPTLEMLTQQYDVIVFKHCFPVSAVEEDTGSADVTSEDKRAENYKLQYAALKEKLHQFPNTRFILWTGAALLQSETDEASAGRARAFFDWVRQTWDTSGDNIFVWDFRTIETDGGLYLKAEYGSGDSHPNETFSRRAAPMFCQRVVDVIGGAGDSGSITGGTGKPKVAPKPTKPTSKPAKPEAPEAEPAPKPGPDAWVFDDAEDAKREASLWGQCGQYVEDGKGHVTRIAFAAGKEEDWGEYGQQRIVSTVRPDKNHDISQYKYLAFRVRTDRAMELVVTLVTQPDSLPRTEESHFGFSAYTHPKPGDWEWVVLDLTKLELGAEGDKAYAAAGKPTRPQELTSLRLVTNKKNEAANVAIDDMAFYRTLPKELAGKVHTP